MAPVEYIRDRLGASPRDRHAGQVVHALADIAPRTLRGERVADWLPADQLRKKLAGWKPETLAAAIRRAEEVGLIEAEKREHGRQFIRLTEPTATAFRMTTA